MSKTRKILSIVLAVVLAFGVFSICAFADTDTATWTVEVTNLDGTALGASISTGDKVLVTVKLQSNFYVGTVGLPVVFSDAFEYVANTASQVEIYGAGATRTAFNDNFTDGIASGYSAVYAVYVPNSSASGVASPMYSSATTILTFQLEAVSENAGADIKLDPAMQKTSTNIGGKFYCGSRATADVTTDETMVGQTFVTAAATQTVVISNTVATPELQGISTGYVDNTNMYVYGVPANTAVADFTNYFTVTNGGSFEMSANGTGATLTVKDAGGNAVTTYTLVIFGDVNGDGVVALGDYVALKAAVTGTALTGAFYVAGDVNGDNVVALGDYVALKAAVTGGGYTIVNPYA